MSGLALHGVGHRYPGAVHDAVDDLSLEVPQARMVAVVGPSGSGKSTLLRIAAGLVRPTRGRVSVGGDDVTDLATERRDLTVMFQQPHLFDHLDVGGNVAFGPRVSGVARREARRRAERYLALVHLDGLGGRDVSSLSGGQQQRVALARALATERRVLLLDEPFAALDRELRSVMHDLLAEVRAAIAPTVLMVTHDLDEAGLAEVTVVLIDGTVHQQAPASLLHREPATLAVARLVGGFTEVPGRVRDGVHHSGWGGVPLIGHCDAADEAVLLLRREDLEIAGGPAPGVPGRVVRVRPAGARRVVTVALDGGSSAEVELGPGRPVPDADRVVLSPRAGLRAWAVVRAPHDAGTRPR